MAKSAQEKADLKAEKIYEKAQEKYRARPGETSFQYDKLFGFTLFTVACIFRLLPVYKYNQRQRFGRERVNQFYPQRASSR